MFTVTILNPHSDRFETWTYHDVALAQYVWDWAAKHGHRVSTPRP